MFRSWVTVLCFLTAAMLSPAWATGEGGQGRNAGNKSGGSSRLERQVQIETRFITVRATESRRFEIDWVALGDGQTTVFADVSKGVDLEDQDRVNLSFIPFLSQVTGDRYTGDDVSPQTRVGSAYILNRILFVALDGNLTNLLSPPRIVVLNNKWAFEMKDPPLPIDWPNHSDLAGIGDFSVFSSFATPNVSPMDTRTALIGGLDTQQKVAAASRIPMLGDIPTLGRLFLGSAHQRDQNKLVILLRPSITVTGE